MWRKPVSESSVISLTMLCQQIAEEGQTPSVAMLRAKAPYKVSVTEAISAIKSFNGAKLAPRPTLKQPTKGELEERVKDLENAVAVLEKRLNALTAD